MCSFVTSCGTSRLGCLCDYCALHLQDVGCFAVMSRIFNTVYHWFFYMAAFFSMLTLICFAPAVGFFAGAVHVLYRGCGTNR